MGGDHATATPVQCHSSLIGRSPSLSPSASEPGVPCTAGAGGHRTCLRSCCPLARFQHGGLTHSSGLGLSDRGCLPEVTALPRPGPRGVTRPQAEGCQPRRMSASTAPAVPSILSQLKLSRRRIPLPSILRRPQQPACSAPPLRGPGPPRSAVLRCLTALPPQALPRITFSMEPL